MLHVGYGSVADIGAALAKVFGGLRERDRAELLDALSLQRGVLDRYPGMHFAVLAHLCGAAHFTDIACNLGA